MEPAAASVALQHSRRPGGIALVLPSAAASDESVEQWSTLLSRNSWLHPAEIVHIITYFCKTGMFELTEEPPRRPVNGSIFMSRWSHRLPFCRNDGHTWQKKKDCPNQVREDRHKLKVSSVDTLLSLRAHCEDTIGLHRSCYRLLKGTESERSVVLIHYRSEAPDGGAAAQQPHARSCRCLLCTLRRPLAVRGGGVATHDGAPMKAMVMPAVRVPKADRVFLASLAAPPPYTMRDLAPERILIGSGEKLLLCYQRSTFAVKTPRADDIARATWGAVFRWSDGLVDVPAETLGTGVVRCFAPVELPIGRCEVRITMNATPVTDPAGVTVHALPQTIVSTEPSSTVGESVGVGLGNLSHKRSRRQRVEGTKSSSVHSSPEMPPPPPSLGSGGNKVQVPISADEREEAEAEAERISVEDLGEEELYGASEALLEKVTRLLVDVAHYDEGLQHELDALDDSGFNLLHYTVMSNHTRLVALLLDRGASAQTATSEGDSPLHLAAESGHAEVARLLLDAGASPIARDRSGRLCSVVAWEHGFQALATKLASLDGTPLESLLAALTQPAPFVTAVAGDATTVPNSAAPMLSSMTAGVRAPAERVERIVAANIGAATLYGGEETWGDGAMGSPERRGHVAEGDIARTSSPDVAMALCGGRGSPDPSISAVGSGQISKQERDTKLLRDAIASLSLKDKCALDLSLNHNLDSIYSHRLGGASVYSDSESDVASIVSDMDSSSLRVAMSAMAVEEREQLETEAKVIQNNFRAWMLRRNFQDVRVATRRVQHVAKGFLARRAYRRDVESVVKVQAFGKMVATKRRTKEKRQANLTLQAATRGMLTRREFRALKRRLAASLVIQKSVRSRMSLTPNPDEVDVAAAAAIATGASGGGALVGGKREFHLRRSSPLRNEIATVPEADDEDEEDGAFEMEGIEPIGFGGLNEDVALDDFDALLAEAGSEVVQDGMGDARHNAGERSHDRWH